ncbi:MAG TPA: ATP-binding cassette domain-containing protein [Allosphingosinicella sp.]
MTSVQRDGSVWGEGMGKGVYGDPELRFRDVFKRFGATRALDGVSFDVAPGIIHAVLGQNGAGKTTLMKILMGIYRQDSGEVLRNGESVAYRGPKEALAAGVGMLFQNSTLIRSLTIAENLALGGASAKPQSVMPGFNPQRIVGELSRAERQLVELQRLLDRSASILVLDEPTAALTPLEAGALFDRLLAFKACGKTILLITHKLREVEAYADAVTVLRDGKVVASDRATNYSISQLAALMVGESTSAESPRAPVAAQHTADVMLSVSGLALRTAPAGSESQINFKLRRGECIGVAGVAGNGQRELVEALTSGSAAGVLFSGKPFKADARRHIAYVPDNAPDLAVANALSVRDNVMLNAIAWPLREKQFWVNEAAYSDEAEARLQRFGVKYADLRAPASSLSGGNLHKLILAREFANTPSLAIVVNPTAGLDIKSTKEIRDHLRHAKEGGCALLFVSNELEEILELADRILVLSDGRAVGDMPRHEAGLARIGELMGGHVVSEIQS